VGASVTQPSEAEVNERILARYFNVPSIKGDNRQIVKRFLLGAVWAAILTPLLFYLKFGTINWFSISFAIFLVALCLLFALGFHFQTKTEYHTNVPLEGNLADRIGAFWLVACAFGPFIGWIITSFSPSESSWKWQYLARAFLAVILPLITAVPLVPYVRGRATLIAVPLLILITALPVLSCYWVLADLNDGPQKEVVEIVPYGPEGCRSLSQSSKALPCSEMPSDFRNGDRVQLVWLAHTRRVLSRIKVETSMSP
jgi:hypothetical protein